MKKFLLSVSLIMLCLCLVGCSNAQEDLAAKLDAHLNRLSATLSSVQDIKNSDITYQVSSTKNSATQLKNPVVKQNMNDFSRVQQSDYSNKIDSTIYDDVLCTNDCLSSCKSQMFELIEMLKSLSAKIKKSEIKLNDNQMAGVNELLSNLAVNTNRISMSKNETNTEVGKVKSLIKNSDNNQSALNSRFIRLNNCLETRLTYFKNCLNVLNQIRVLLACEDGNCTYKDGKVCIDGKCFDETELNKYGDINQNQSQGLNHEKTLSENDLKLFEEFKNYLEKTRKENEQKNIDISNHEEKIENQIQNYPETLEIKDISKSKPVFDEQKQEESVDKSEQRNDSETHAIQNSQHNNTNQFAENQTNQNKQTNQPAPINDNNRNHPRNIDTFGNPTVKPNIDSYKKINGKIVSPSQMFLEWMSQKPFPEKITETNIIIFSEQDTDKQFVENTKVAQSEQKSA